MAFPYDFGYIPNTKGGDGDPLDIIAISEFTSFTGCAMDCRIIGAMMAEQTERDGQTMRNDRFFGIPEESEQFKLVNEVSELPKQIIKQLENFFTNYNSEAGKKFKVLSIVGHRAAMNLISKTKRRIKTNKVE